jgi:hypothetical protein
MRISYANCGLLATAVTLSLWSCSDDDLTGKADRGDNSINFTSHIATTAAKNNSRSTDFNRFEDFTAEKLDNSELFLITAVEDGIDATKLASNEGEATSRATMVTANNIANLYEGKGIDLCAYTYNKKDAYSGKSSYNFADVLNDNTAGVATYISGEYLKIGKPTTGDSYAFTLTPRQRQYWSSSDKNITFFGIFPSKSDYDNANYVVTYANNEPTLSYIVENDVTLQRDILCAQQKCSGDGTETSFIANLGLRHIMSAVSVTLGTGFSKANDVITGITFGNITVGGTYNLAKEEWTATKTDKVEYSAAVADASDALNNDNNRMFMMIPQTMSNASTITVKVYNKAENTERQFTKTIAGFSWPMGKTVNFQISTDDKFTEYFIEPEFDTMYFSWDGTPAGNTDQFMNGSTTQITDLGYTRVKSYKCVTDKAGNHSYTNLAWTATVAGANTSGIQYPQTSGTPIEASDVDGTDYVQYDTTADDYTHFNSRRYNYKFKVNIGEQSPEKLESDDSKKIDANKNVVFGSTSDYVDLSIYKQEYTSVVNGKAVPVPYNSNKSRNTANCYMIQYPGYYEIPVVYGNGYKNGTLNSSAYKLGTSNTGAMTNLRTYSDNNIDYKPRNTAWIEYWSAKDDFGYPGADGKNAMEDVDVLWQDVQGMVDVSKYTDKRTDPTAYKDAFYIRFYIAPNKIKPGNAVIIVKNKNKEILWSYHIWVTPYSSQKTTDRFTADANVAGSIGTASFMNVPLGFVQEDYLHYPERSAVMTLTQAESGETCAINLVQKDHTCACHSCVYYQWGRKDPFPGATIVEDGHMYYDDSYKVKYEPKKIWTGSGTLTGFAKVSNHDKTVGDGIKNPSSFFVTSAYTGGATSAGNSNRFPDDKNYYDLWGCTFWDGGTSDPADFKLPGKEFGSSSRKTVYDPCPYGFRVPPIYAFPAITIDGTNFAATVSPWIQVATEESDLYENKINTSFKTHDEFINTGGYKFYKAKMISEGKKAGGDTYTIYAMGGIDAYGNYGGIGSDCLYWACTNWVSTWWGIYNHRNYFMHLSYSGKSDFVPVTGNTESFGYAVLPMVER